MNFRYFIFLSVIISSSCDKKSVNCGVECDTNEELLFQTGFNGTTLTNGAYKNVEFSGVDSELADHNDWTDFINNPSVGYVEVGYEDGEDNQRLAEIKDDPDSVGNKVLSFKINEPHIKEGSHQKGRVQLSVNDNQCIREIYQTVRLKLHPDMAYLKEWNERMPWLTLFEFWNNATWSNEKKTFRVTVNLFKDAEGPVDEIHFHAKADHQKCNVCEWKGDWEEEADHFSVPFGVWMELELYLVEGDESNGRFYMSVTPEGGTKTVLFDITNRTHHENEKCPDGFTHFQPMKLYTSDAVINYMKEGGKNLEIFWDDWKLYRNKSF
jgi:hypothetical protein